MRRYTRIRHHKRLPSRVLLALRRRGKRAVSFLARACFSVSETAPMVTPHIAEDGSSWTVTDVEGDKCHTEGNAFIVDALDTAGYGRAVVRSDTAVTIAPGVACFFNLDTLISNTRVGWGPSTATGANITGFKSPTAMLLTTYAGAFTIVVPSITNQCMFVIIGDGQTFIVADERLIYVINSNSYSSYQYPQFATYSGGDVLNQIASLNLTANGYKKWASSFAHETDSLSAPASGKIFSRDESAVISYGVTYESATNLYVYNRFVAASNYYILFYGTSNSLYIRKYVDSVLTTLYSGSGILTDGTHYTVDSVESDGNVEVFLNGSSLGVFDISDVEYNGGKITHTLATNDIELTTHPYPALGIATSRTIYPQSHSTQTTKADVWLDLESVTLPSVSTDRIIMTLRETSANDIVKIYIYGDGKIAVSDIVGGSYYGKIFGAAGTVTTGDRIALSLDGSSGRLYVNNTFINSSNSFVNQAQSNFDIETLSGGSISAVTCYPIDCSRLLPTIPDCPNTVLTYLTNNNSDAIYAGSDRIGGW